MTVLNILAPVFLIIVLGVILARTRFVSEAFMREANRVTYWLGLPALLFSSLTKSFHDAAGAKPMLNTLLLATAAVVAVGYLVAWILRLRTTQFGTFVQGSFRGNLAYVGLPIIYTLPDSPGTTGLSARAAAVIAVAPMLVLYNVLGVGVLMASRHEVSRGMIMPLLRQLATTPPLLATIAGIGWALAGWPLPPAISLSFEWLGQMALPLALLGIGGALARTENIREWKAPLSSALVKTIASPGLGWLIGRQLGLQGLELSMVMIFLACPTAGISYTMVSQLDGDETMASSTILFSTLTAVATLSVIIGVL